MDRLDPATGRPALNFKHALLPHVPWQYLPDGRQYRRAATEPIPGSRASPTRTRARSTQLQLRHLLQVGLRRPASSSRLIARLKQLGIYDDALVVVTADHGVSFKQGQFDRRNVNRGNIDEITPVPLFVKAPGQSKGRVDDAIVETTDIAAHDRRRAGHRAARRRWTAGRRSATRSGAGDEVQDAQARPVRLDRA